MNTGKNNYRFPNLKVRTLSMLLAASLLLGTAGCATDASSTAETVSSSTTQTSESLQTGQTDITIIGTSDLHANIWGYSYEDQADTDNNGLARVSTYVNEVRAQEENVILVDNGDTVQGTILSDDLYNKAKFDELHPMITVMNAMNYDAMTVGNHEFNFGLDLINKISEEANFPVLGANVKVKEDGSDFLPPYTVIERGGVTFGIIGEVTPNVPRWDGEKVDSLEFLALGQTAETYAQKLKEEEGVDFVIALVHAGWTAEYDEDGKSDAAEMVAEQAPSVDIMVIGHNHVVFTSGGGDDPTELVVGAPRNSGRDAVRIDIAVDLSGEEPAITKKSVEVVDMQDYAVDQTVRDLTAEAHQATLDFINGGGTGAEGSEGGGILGTATANFQPENEIKDIPQARLEDTALVDLVNTVQLKYSGADVSAAALFKDTSHLNEGDIIYANVFDIYKFDNTLYVVEVTGAELKNYMEWSASYYNQWKEGDVSISFNPDVPGYLYDMFAGVEYKIDLSQPVGSRIQDVMFQGAPLTDDQVLTLAVNNYRYSSALKGENLVAATRSWESPVSIRDYIVQYITETGTLSPSVDNNWEIVGVNLESPYRAQIIEMVNNGELEIPYDHSLNVNELAAEGIITVE